MYRAPSPIFDVPEFPTLRRVKPLPKRRRTSESISLSSLPPSLPTLPDNININLNNLNLNLSLGTFLEGLQLPGPDATAEELLAHAETLSARMALHSYYLPMSGAGTGGGQPGATNNIGYGMREHDSDEGGGGGDYIDHLQQPNNTKKRKVPANASLSSRSHHAASSPSPSPSPDHDIHAHASSSPSVAEVYHPPSSGGMGWGWGRTGRKGKEEAKLGKATLAGLRHKEMLKTRKRQLAAVLGALSVGDTLALDQALSASYPSVSGALSALEGDVRVRLSKRCVVRLASRHLVFSFGGFCAVFSVGMYFSWPSLSEPIESAKRLDLCSNLKKSDNSRS